MYAIRNIYTGDFWSNEFGWVDSPAEAQIDINSMESEDFWFDTWGEQSDTLPMEGEWIVLPHAATAAHVKTA